MTSQTSKQNTGPAVVNVQTVLNESPFSRFQWGIFFLCFLIVLLDGFDTAAIGFIAPSLLGEWGIPVSQRKLSLNELFDAAKAGTLKEVFATGTAAVISPIGTLCYKGDDYAINNNEVGPLSQKLYDTLSGIQTGKLPDTRGWVERVS